MNHTSSNGPLSAGAIGVRANRMSYRQTAPEVGLHWTRVQQIVPGAEWVQGQLC